MVSKDRSFSIRSLLFDGTNYAFCKIRMRAYLMYDGVVVWYSMLDSYKAPSIPPIEPNENQVEINFILSGLVDLRFVKVM